MIEGTSLARCPERLTVTKPDEKTWASVNAETGGVARARERAVEAGAGMDAGARRTRSERRPGVPKRGPSEFSVGYSGVAEAVRAISPDDHSRHPAFRSLEGNLASPSWLRSVSYAARLAGAASPTHRVPGRTRQPGNPLVVDLHDEKVGGSTPRQRFVPLGVCPHVCCSASMTVTTTCGSQSTAHCRTRESAGLMSRPV